MISGSPGDVKGRVAVYSVESFRLTLHQLLLYSAPHPPAASETRATYTNFREIFHWAMSIPATGSRLSRTFISIHGHQQ